LRDWLLGLARDAGVQSLTTDDRDDVQIEPSPLHEKLVTFGGDPLAIDRTGDQRALGIAAAAIDYHRREQKSFWWGHYSRLAEPIDEWADTRDCFVIERAVLDRDWHREGKQRSDRRHLIVRG